MSLPTGVEQEWLGGSLLSIHALAQRVVWEWMRDPAADPEMARTVWMTSFIWHVSLSSWQGFIILPFKLRVSNKTTVKSNDALGEEWETPDSRFECFSPSSCRASAHQLGPCHARRISVCWLLPSSGPRHKAIKFGDYEGKLVNNNKDVDSMAEINGKCCDFFLDNGELVKLIWWFLTKVCWKQRLFAFRGQLEEWMLDINIMWFVSTICWGQCQIAIGNRRFQASVLGSHPWNHSKLPGK